MPCRFDCPATIAWVEGVRADLSSEDPAAVTEIDRRLRLPVLSVREQNVYAFEGVRCDDGSVRYDSFYRL